MVQKGDDAQSPSAYDYYVVGILALIYMFSTIDRTLISVLAEPIKEEFALSDGQIGLLTGAAFAISYSAAGIPLGMLADRLVRVRLLASLVSVWSFLTVASSLATGWVTLALARVGVAAAESGASPAAMSLITDYFGKERRGFAMSLFYVSTPLGVAISFVLGGYLASLHGWRSVFVYAGLPGLILAGLVLFTIAEPKRGQKDAAETKISDDIRAEADKQKKSHVREAFNIIMGTPAILLLILAAASVVVAQASLSAFMAPFFIRFHDMDIAQAGLTIGLAKGITGVIGIVVGGIVADRLAKVSMSGSPRVVGLLMILAAPFAITAFIVSDWRVAIAFVAAYNILNYTYYGATFATYMTIAPAKLRGVLGAILAVALNIVGYGFGPPLAGLTSDLLAGFGIADHLRWALVITSIFFAIAGILYIATSQAIRRVESRNSEPVGFAA
ncbi:MFS transporter [Croceicoccus ponticola]|nr:MFS transporter [Croceicoccus ponticola]